MQMTTYWMNASSTLDLTGTEGTLTSVTSSDTTVLNVIGPDNQGKAVIQGRAVVGNVSLTWQDSNGNSGSVPINLTNSPTCPSGYAQLEEQGNTGIVGLDWIVPPH